MKTLVVAAALMVFMLAYYSSDAVPIDTTEETKTQSPVSNDTDKEAVYLIKQTTYEIGIVDTLDINNASAMVLVKPEDRIETDDISIWTSDNETNLHNKAIAENNFGETTSWEPSNETALTEEPLCTNTTEPAASSPIEVVPEAAGTKTVNQETAAESVNQKTAAESINQTTATESINQTTAAESINQTTAAEPLNQTTAATLTIL